MKDKNTYSYTLRFDKDATLDHQALFREIFGH